MKLGSGPPDRYLFNEEIFEIGSPIAVVAAENEHIAGEAIHLIEVQYEVLPATLDMMDGVSPSAPEIQPGRRVVEEERRKNKRHFRRAPR